MGRFMSTPGDSGRHVGSGVFRRHKAASGVSERLWAALDTSGRAMGGYGRQWWAAGDGWPAVRAVSVAPSHHRHGPIANPSLVEISARPLLSQINTAANTGPSRRRRVEPTIISGSPRTISTEAPRGADIAACFVVPDKFCLGVIGRRCRRAQAR